MARLQRLIGAGKRRHSADERGEALLTVPSLAWFGTGFEAADSASGHFHASEKKMKFRGFPRRN
jgi:hypothetical protein